MTITVRPMTGDDLEAASALYGANARDALTAEERATQGFVQSRIPVERLRRMAEAGTAFVAEVDGEIAGVALTHRPERFEGKGTEGGPGPESAPAKTIQVVREAGLAKPILYGPAVVAESHRGQGVLRALDEAVLAAVADLGYETAIAFMELENTASVEAHRKLGWTRIGGFTSNDREYEVVSRATA